MNGLEEEELLTSGIKARPQPAKCLPGRAGLSSQDGLLPDEETITSLSLTGAWEKEVDVVNSEVVPLLRTALQMYLQNLLTECVRSSKDHHMDEHGVPFGFNSPHPAYQRQHLPSLISLKKRAGVRVCRVSRCACDENSGTRSTIQISHLIQVPNVLGWG